MREKFLVSERENPKMRKNMNYFGRVGSALSIVLLAVFISGCAKEVVKDQSLADPGKSTIIAETYPADLADTVVINPVVAVNFKTTADSSDVSASTLTLKEGTISVQGTVSHSGTTATFTPSADLKPSTIYTATIKTNLKSTSDDGGHSWTFTTGKGRRDNGNNALSIVSVFPLKNATSVPVTIQPIVTFKDGMSSLKIKSMKFTLKQGTTTVNGSLAFSGKTATFIPTSSLTANKVYTVTVTSGVKNGDNDQEDDGDDQEDDDDDQEGDDQEGDDQEGDDNHQSVNTYSWSFTTGGGGTDITAPTVLSVIPVNSATLIAVNSKATVTFSETMNATTITTANFTLKQGATTVAGTVANSGTTATFTPTSSLTANSVYTGTVTTGAKDAAGNAIASNYTWSFTTSSAADVTAPTVLSVIPANNATLVAVNSKATVTFSEAMNVATITTANFTLKQGATTVAGTVAYSGTTATFTPASGLTANTVYTGTVTTGAKDAAGNAIASNYAWSFTTSAAADVTAPTVLSVIPANNATLVVVNSKATVTFSEAMNAATITNTTFTLKQGSTNVSGSVAYSGTIATFTPASSLTANTVYIGTVTTGAKDASGNSIASNYTWSFTTAAAADVTAPTVLTMAPANSATSIAVNSNVSATFSEAMNSSTITSTTYTLKQGTTSVAGSVSYSGTTATFNPTSDLAGDKVYTATITTGAKDAAGNAITAAKTWSFTTIAVATVVSWSTQVWPIIQNKCTPCHGSSGGSAGVNMGSYAQVAAMSNSRIDNPRMYSEMGVTAAEQAIIKAWIAAGKLNN